MLLLRARPPGRRLAATRRGVAAGSLRPYAQRAAAQRAWPAALLPRPGSHDSSVWPATEANTNPRCGLRPETQAGCFLQSQGNQFLRRNVSDAPYAGNCKRKRDADKSCHDLRLLYAQAAPRPTTGADRRRAAPSRALAAAAAASRPRSMRVIDIPIHPSPSPVLAHRDTTHAIDPVPIPSPFWPIVTLPTRQLEL